MKNTIEHIIMVILMFALIFVGIYYNNKNVEHERRVKYEQIIELKSELKELKKTERYGFVVGDTTLQVISKFNIQNEPYKYLHIKRIKPGKNKYDFALNEKTRIEIIIMKY